MNHSKPAILHTIHSLKSSCGGPSRTVPSLCEAVARTGAFRVFLLTTRSPDEQNLLPNANHVTTIELPFSERPWTSHLRRRFLGTILDIHRSHKIDLIHDHGQWLATNRAAANAAHILMIPRVVSPRGMLSPWALGRRKWIKRLLWNLYGRKDMQTATRIHSTSQLEMAELKELGLKPPIDVIPNGIDLRRAMAGESDPDQPRIALFLSRIHPKKGLEDLLVAWSRTRPRGWKVIVAGPDEGGYLNQLQRRSLQLGIDEDINFMGPIDGDAKWNLYQRASLFVLPSYSENFGVVVAEALAAGVPVITTRATPWEMLEIHRCGWWIEPNAEALEITLRAACEMSSEELESMGQRGRTVVASEFGWDRIGTSMARTYQRLLACPQLASDRRSNSLKLL